MIYWLLFILADVIGNYLWIGIVAIIHASLIMQVTDWYTWLPVLGYQLASHFTLFSPLLNVMRKKPFTYRGKNSGWLDSIATGDYPWIYWTLYGIAALFFIKTIIGL